MLLAPQPVGIICRQQQGPVQGQSVKAEGGGEGEESGVGGNRGFYSGPATRAREQG